MPYGPLQNMLTGSFGGSFRSLRGRQRETKGGTSIFQPYRCLRCRGITYDIRHDLAAASHRPTVTLSYCHTVRPSDRPTVLLSDRQTVLLSDRHTVRPSHRHTVNLPPLPLKIPFSVTWGLSGRTIADSAAFRLMTGLFQSPNFRFSVGSIQYRKRVFLKTEYSKLVTTGLFAKVLVNTMKGVS
jgi:hypothetical protein